MDPSLYAIQTPYEDPIEREDLDSELSAEFLTIIDYLIALMALDEESKARRRQKSRYLLKTCPSNEMLQRGIDILKQQIARMHQVACRIQN